MLRGEHDYNRAPHCVHCVHCIPFLALLSVDDVISMLGQTSSVLQGGRMKG